MDLKEATLLVVDDEPNYREIITKWFEKEGSCVVSAENGIDALKELQKQEINAIITDIRMPEMSGTELVKRARASGKYRPVAVAITGFSDLTAREAYDLGIETQLSKPVTRRALVSAVRSSLMEREQLWAGPFRATTLPVLKLQFESLGSSLLARKILFGHGGFCVATPLSLPEASTVDFELDFADDQEMIALQGIVRWSAPEERLAGIEITRVNDQSRSWVAALARANQTVSFIPRST